MGVHQVDTIQPTTANAGVQVEGVKDGSAIAVGYKGEVITNFDATSSISTGVYRAITSIPLTPGRWAISTTCSISASSTSTTSRSMSAGISTSNSAFSNATEADWIAGQVFREDAPAVSPVAFGTLVVPSKVVDISSATTYFLGAIFTGSIVGSVTVQGRITAIRL